MDVILYVIFSNTFSWMKLWIAIDILQKFVPRGPNNDILAMVQIMVW